jgi:hypothetical protein
MAVALHNRPVQMPRFPTAAPGTPNRGYTPAAGAAISTDEDDEDITMDEFPDAGIVA